MWGWRNYPQVLQDGVPTSLFPASSMFSGAQALVLKCKSGHGICLNAVSYSKRELKSFCVEKRHSPLSGPSGPAPILSLPFFLFSFPHPQMTDFKWLHVIFHSPANGFRSSVLIIIIILICQSRTLKDNFKVRWLILCVNLTKPLGIQKFGKALFCLWQYFWLRWSSKLIDCIYQFSLLI